VNNPVMRLPMLQWIAIRAVLVSIHNCVFADDSFNTAPRFFCVTLATTAIRILPPRSTSATMGVWTAALCFQIALSANECLVNFDRSFQWTLEIVAHCETNPMSHKPRRLVSDAKHPVKLVELMDFLLEQKMNIA